jgi:hypothetical protein
MLGTEIVAECSAIEVDNGVVAIAEMALDSWIRVKTRELKVRWDSHSTILAKGIFEEVGEFQDTCSLRLASHKM